MRQDPRLQKQHDLLLKAAITEEKEEFGDLVRKVHDQGLKRAKCRDIYPMSSFLVDIFESIDTGETTRVLDRVTQVKDRFVNDALDEVFGTELRRRIEDARKGKMPFAREIEKLKRSGIEALTEEDMSRLPGQDMKERAQKAQRYCDENFIADFFQFQTDPELKANYQFDWKTASKGQKKPQEDENLTELLGLLSQNFEQEEKRREKRHPEESKIQSTRGTSKTKAQSSRYHQADERSSQLYDLLSEEILSHQRSAGIDITARKKKKH